MPLILGSYGARNPMIVKMDMKSPNLTARLPLSNWVDVTIDWGDGTTSSHTSNYPEHTYAAAGEYTIKITGKAGRLSRTTVSGGIVEYLQQAGWPQLTEVVSFGELGATSMWGAFYGCVNLQKVADDFPSGVTNFSYMFHSCTSLTEIPELDTSSGTNFGSMFFGCSSLTKGRLNGTRYSISYNGCNLSHSAIVDIVDGLGTAVDSSQTLTFTNNPGTTSVSTSEKNIAKNKGWTTNPA